MTIEIVPVATVEITNHTKNRFGVKTWKKLEDVIIPPGETIPVKIKLSTYNTLIAWGFRVSPWPDTAESIEIQTGIDKPKPEKQDQTTITSLQAELAAALARVAELETALAAKSESETQSTDTTEITGNSRRGRRPQKAIDEAKAAKEVNTDSNLSADDAVHSPDSDTVSE